jgi:hypothetical protein
VPSVSQAARPPRGAPVAAVQVPTLPATSHASHWAPQAWSQQTPSVQKPVPHSPSPPQASPGPRVGVQTPPAHQWPAAQSASTAQSPRQAVVPQVNGAQATVSTAGHRPAPSQDAARVAVPEAHEAPRQAVVSPG